MQQLVSAEVAGGVLLVQLLQLGFPVYKTELSGGQMNLFDFR